MEEEIKKLSLQLESLKKALATLNEAIQEPYVTLVRDASIQRFEYTFELAWKVFRRVSKIEGLETDSPRQAIRNAFQLGLISETDPWFQFLEDRNLTSHTYNEERAESVYQSAKKFPAALNTVISLIEKKYLYNSGSK